MNPLHKIKDTVLVFFGFPRKPADQRCAERNVRHGGTQFADDFFEVSARGSTPHAL